ncbi:MAG: hypothetical protein VB138_14225 [Burkholderia sp.]
MTTTTELTVVERAAVALGTSERETELRALVEKSTDITEIKNAAGRDQCHAAAMLLRTARTSIRKPGKDARDDATKFSKAVIAEEDRLVALIEPEETWLIGIRDVWDAAREAEKQAKLEAEQRRVAAIREAIDGIRDFSRAAVGLSAQKIALMTETLEAEAITTDRFAELTGEAEMARGATLDKLRELHEAAVAHEAEQARLAAEREALERERAALAEQQRQEAEARAAREREEAAARAEQERADRERREAEEAARRAQQQREDADRAAREAAFGEIQAIQHQVLIAHTGRAAVRVGGTIECIRETLAETEAWTIDPERFGALAGTATAAKASAIEQIRQLLDSAERGHADRAEREQREREEAKAREAAEAEAQAEQDRLARERAENRAAVLASEPTGGNWKVGRSGAVVTDERIPGCIGGGHDDVTYYGGYLIAESIFRPADAHVLAASRLMFDALCQWQHAERIGDAEELANARAARDAAIERAIYVPTEETAAA